MRVAVRVDAGPLIGGGHAMRCLTLADALAGRGAEVTFVSTAMPEALAVRIDAAGHKLARIPASAALQRDRRDWHEPPLDAAVQIADAQATGSAAGPVDWLIIDHYLLDRFWHSAGRNFAERLLVIDDLANRQYDCDLLLDQTFGRNPTDYGSLVPSRATVLAGAKYALLRPEFEDERRGALDRRNEQAGIERILVSIGTTDIGGSTAVIVEQILSSATNCRVEVVLGGAAPSLGQIRRLSELNPKVTLHVDSRQMARLMRDADLAIGAAGTTSWERCCLGLPTIALVLAENQRPSAVSLASTGALIAVESVDEIGPVLSKLLDEPTRVSQMSAAAFAIADGRGAHRVVSAILGETSVVATKIELRPATLKDSELLWLWRNDPATRAQSRSTDPITWTRHRQWLAAAFRDEHRKIMVAERTGCPIGTIGFHPTEGGVEVSITVAPAERGRGIGQAMLSAACSEAAGQNLFASVRNANLSSRQLFESCGFNQVESNEPGFVRYVRVADHCRRKHA